MFPDIDRPSQLHTQLLMIWGQFVDHDLTRTAITEMHKEDAGNQKGEKKLASLLDFALIFTSRFLRNQRQYVIASE